MKVLFDTNILIDYLLRYAAASRELEQYNNAQISIIPKILQKLLGK